MATPSPRQCPQCKVSFQLRRKNQDYCSSGCRTDFNNQVAKGRYATFRQQAPRVTGVEQEIKKLRDYIASLTIVIEGVTEIDAKTIVYQRRTYRREALLDRSVGQISLRQGGALLLPGGGQIIYRTLQSSAAGHAGRYVVDH